MKMRKQRYMGAALVVLSWLILLLAATGQNKEDQDATAAVLILPLGLYMIFTKDYVLYDGEPVKMEPETDPWAPSSPTAIPPHPLHPFKSPFYEQFYREETTTWQENE